jgi:alcohol dehydrogenase
MKKLPMKMRAAVIERYGENEQVNLVTVSTPRVDMTDVLVEVKAASVNPLDTRIRDGKLKQVLPFKMPLILGNDFAGIVVATGSQATKFKVGDEVYARSDTVRIGSFAEYTVIEERNLSLKPKNLTMEEAASLPLVALTAWQVLVEKAHITKGQKVLIHGGAGGVGSIAVQLAKHLGAYVATTASKTDFATVKKYGADQVIDYRTEDFSTVLKEYDLVLDTRGGETLDKSFYILKRGGTVVSVNGTPDANMARELGLHPVKRLLMTLLSFNNSKKAKKLGVHYAFHFMKPSGVQLEKLRSLFEDGTLRPIVDKVYPFESVKKALAHSESGKAKGKIVLKI